MMASEGHCSSHTGQNYTEEIFYTSIPRTKGIKYYLQQRRREYCLAHGLTPPHIPSVRKIIVRKSLKRKDNTYKSSAPSNLDTVCNSNRTSAQTKIRSRCPHPPEESVIVSEVPDGGRRNCSVPVKGTACCSTRSCAQTEIGSCSPLPLEESVMVSEVPDGGRRNCSVPVKGTACCSTRSCAQTEIGSCSPLPLEESVMVSEVPDGGRRNCSVPVKDTACCNNRNCAQTEIGPCSPLPLEESVMVSEVPDGGRRNCSVPVKDTACCSTRNCAQTEIGSCSPLPLKESVMVSEGPDGGKRNCSVPVKDTACCNNRNCAQTEIGSCSPLPLEESVMVSEVPDGGRRNCSVPVKDTVCCSNRNCTQTEIGSCSPLPHGESVTVSEVRGEGKTSSMPLKISQHHLKVKAKCVNRYRSLAPQSSASHGSPRKRKRNRRKKKSSSYPVGPNENLTLSEKPQLKSKCEENDMHSSLNLPPSDLTSLTGPLTQAIFTGNVYQQQDSRCKNSLSKNFSSETSVVLPPLPDITVNIDSGDKQSSLSSSTSSKEFLNLASNTEMSNELPKMTKPQLAGLKPPADKVSDSSNTCRVSSSSPEVIGTCWTGAYKDAVPPYSSQILGFPSITEMQNKLHKMEEHPVGLKSALKGKLSDSSHFSTSMEEAEGGELDIYRSYGSAQNTDGAKTKNAAFASYEQPLKTYDPLDHLLGNRNNTVPMKTKSSKNAIQEISSCSDVDLYSDTATEHSVLPQKTNIKRKKTKLSLSQKRKISGVASSSEEKEKTHEGPDHTAQRKKNKSEKIKTLSAFPEQSDTAEGWVGKTTAGQQSLLPSDEPPPSTSSSIKGQCSFPASTDGINDSSNSQATSDIERRISPHFLESRSHECLKHIVGILIQVYGCSMEECMEALSKNQYNLLTTLLELQTIQP